MGIGKKMTKGMIGGGVNIAHKSKMSNAAKNQMSFPGGMPGPGNYGSMDNKIVGKGMMKYMSGEPVGMAKYKSNAQRKAAHASMAEQGAGKYGKHMGPEKALVGKQENLPEALKAKIEAAPGMYGKKKKGMKQMGEMEEPPMSGGPSKYGKHKGPKQEGVVLSPRQKEAAAKKAAAIKKGEEFQAGNFTSSDSGKSKKPMSDMEKIQSSKKAKIKAAKAKKAEGQSDLKKARETKFISRGSGEDSEVSTRKERRTAIRAARKKKREGKKAERKARKGTVIKQKSVRIKKSDD